MVYYGICHHIRYDGVYSVPYDMMHGMVTYSVWYIMSWCVVWYECGTVHGVCILWYVMVCRMVYDRIILSKVCGM